MPQLIVSLIALFIVVSIFRGVAKGAQVCWRVIAWLFTPTFRRRAPAAKPAPALPAPAAAEFAPAQGCLEQLRELHGLYQNGVLSREEFEQFKQSLLSSIAGTAVQP